MISATMSVKLSDVITEPSAGAVTAPAARAATSALPTLANGLTRSTTLKNRPRAPFAGAFGEDGNGKVGLAGLRVADQDGISLRYGVTYPISVFGLPVDLNGL